MINMRHHFFNLWSLVPAGLKILPHPVFQADGLSDINNCIPVVMHNINSRMVRKLLQFLPNVK